MQLSDAVFTPYAESLYPTDKGKEEVKPGPGWWGVQPGVSSDSGRVQGGGSADRRRDSLWVLDDEGTEETVRHAVRYTSLLRDYQCTSNILLDSVVLLFKLLYSNPVPFFSKCVLFWLLAIRLLPF